MGNEGSLLILDAGSGIANAHSQVTTTTRRIDILLTHLHMDHIQGLGFFRPLYDPAIETHIWGPLTTRAGLAERLVRYLSPPLFPVRLRDLPSLHLHDVPPGRVPVPGFKIHADLVIHPGPTLGYRIVEDGNTVTDWEDEEIERKITISTGVAHCEWNKKKINILDTPGYRPFLTETKLALRVADAAVVVIDSVAGVEVQTEKVWEFCDEFGLPRIIVLNKMDRDNASFERALESVVEIFGRAGARACIAVSQRPPRGVDVLPWIQEREQPENPILDPIHFGFMDSLGRYAALRRARPEAEILMGAGNLTELTDADSSGVTAALMGIFSELRITNVLVGRVSPHCRRAIEETDAARRIMFAAREERSLPSGIDPALLDRERELQQRLSAKAERLWLLGQSGKNSEQAAAIRAEMDAITLEQRDLAAQIRVRSPRYAALKQPQPLTLPEIQKQVLDSDTILLEYALGTASDAENDRSYLWLVTSTDPNSSVAGPQSWRRCRSRIRMSVTSRAIVAWS